MEKRSMGMVYRFSTPKSVIRALVMLASLAVASCDRKHPPQSVSVNSPAPAVPKKTISIEEATRERELYFAKHHERWRSYRFESFTTMGGEYRGLTIRHDSKGEPALDAEKYQLLISRIAWFLRSLRARNFSEFRTAINSDLPEKPRVAIPSWIKRHLVHEKLLATCDGLSDEELLQLYWSSHTDLGQGHRFYDGYAPEASSYQVVTIDSPLKENQAAYLLWKGDLDIPLGVTSKTSQFYYGLDKKDIGGNRKRALTVLARIHVHTKPLQGPSNPYPIMIWFAWNDSMRTWIPLEVFELYSGKRRYFPIY